MEVISGTLPDDDVDGDGGGLVCSVIVAIAYRFKFKFRLTVSRVAGVVKAGRVDEVTGRPTIVCVVRWNDVW